VTHLEALRAAWAHVSRVGKWLVWAYVFVVICAALVGGMFVFSMMMKAVFA